MSLSSCFHQQKLLLGVSPFPRPRAVPQVSATLWIITYSLQVWMFHTNSPKSNTANDYHQLKIGMPKTKYVHHLTLNILNKRSKNYMVQTSKKKWTKHHQTMSKPFFFQPPHVAPVFSPHLQWPTLKLQGVGARPRPGHPQWRRPREPAQWRDHGPPLQPGRIGSAGTIE